MKYLQLTSAFLSRARSWWAEFVAIRSDFRSRPVKVSRRTDWIRPFHLLLPYLHLKYDEQVYPTAMQVMARCEDGSQYPSTTFLAPLQLGRLLPTPRHAARFVSLLRRREDEEEAGIGVLGGAGAGLADGASGCWSLPHTMLASRSASRVRRDEGIDQMNWTICIIVIGSQNSVSTSDQG